MVNVRFRERVAHRRRRQPRKIHGDVTHGIGERGDDDSPDPSSPQDAVEFRGGHPRLATPDDVKTVPQFRSLLPGPMIKLCPVVVLVEIERKTGDIPQR